VAAFRGHLYSSAAVSAAAALGVDTMKWAEPEQALALFFLGLISGLLPDIDSNTSTSARALFTLLGVAAAFVLTSSLEGDFSVAESLLIWSAVFLLVRFGLFEVFARLTVHRGIWHSWLAAAFSALTVADAVHYLCGYTAWESWLAAIFVALGYLTHLCFDEIASLDLRNARIRRSFGTALKPFSTASPVASVAMFLGALVLAYLAPSIEPVVAIANELWTGEAHSVAKSAHDRKGWAVSSSCHNIFGVIIR
jgi:hypothetical protein